MEDACLQCQMSVVNSSLDTTMPSAQVPVVWTRVQEVDEHYGSLFVSTSQTPHIHKQTVDHEM